MTSTPGPPTASGPGLSAPGLRSADPHTPSSPSVARPRPARRDRRGRGLRGPEFGADPPGGTVPVKLTRRERFDQVAVSVMTDVESRWVEELAVVELAVEDIPVLPERWDVSRVPLASLVPATGQAPPRLVLFRRPLEQRAESRTDLEGLVLTVVVEQLADFLGLPPEDVHPDYEP